MGAAWPLLDSTRHSRLTHLLLGALGDAGASDEGACVTALGAARSVLAKAGASTAASALRGAAAAAVARVAAAFPPVAWEFLLSLHDATRNAASGAASAAIASEVYTSDVMRAMGAALPGAVARALSAARASTADAAIAWGIVRAGGWAPPLVAAASIAAPRAAVDEDDETMADGAEPAAPGGGAEGGATDAWVESGAASGGVEYVQLLRALVDAVVAALSVGESASGASAAALSAASALLVADGIAALAPSAARATASGGPDGSSGEAAAILGRIMDRAFRDALVRRATTAMAAAAAGAGASSSSASGAGTDIDDGEDRACIASLYLNALASWCALTAA
jgi:hypothetical protein